MSTEPETPTTSLAVADRDDLDQRARDMLAHMHGTPQACCDTNHLTPDTAPFVWRWLSQPAQVSRWVAGMGLVATAALLHSALLAGVTGAVVIGVSWFTYWLAGRNEADLERVDHELWHDVDVAHRRFTTASSDADKHADRERTDVDSTVIRVQRQLIAASQAGDDIRRRAALTGNDDDTVVAEMTGEREQLRLAAVRGILAIHALANQLEVRQVRTAARWRSYDAALIDDDTAVPALLEHAHRRAISGR